MRDWSLGPSDPYTLTIAADFRLSTPDYTDDHIWELESGGDPPALALYTTYGLRACLMRIFPRITMNHSTTADPATFAAPPSLRRFFPNFLLLTFSPFAGIEVSAEYWISDSHTAAGRFMITNSSSKQISFLFELCGQLVPLEGQSLVPVSLQSVNVLAGHSKNLSPVVFLAGGPIAGPGPYSSLSLDLTLAAGSSRTLTWAEASLHDQQASFDLARRTAARPWDAERAKIELLNNAQTIEVHTGNPEWDAAFAFSQKIAFGLCFQGNQHLPYPSFVLARQPDHGYSPCGDGCDYPHLWSGQPPLETCYLASLLPGAPELAKDLLRNFLAVRSEDGSIDCKPGLAGQRGGWLAAPLLSSLAWQVYQRGEDRAFLEQVFSPLLTFHRQWFTSAHDRDSDCFPEWDHPFQSSFDDHPAFTVWHAWGQGTDISTAESPALAAMLGRDSHFLAKMALLLGDERQYQTLKLEESALRKVIEECWDANAGLYHYRDRDSHHSPTGKPITKQRGIGKKEISKTFKQPVRLLIQIQFKDVIPLHTEIIIKGRNGRKAQTERLARVDFKWGGSRAVATSHKLYTTVTGIEFRGLARRDKIIVRTVDFSFEDLTLFLPLWAGILNLYHARTLVNCTLFDSGRFGRPFGIPACAFSPDNETAPIYQAVHLPWNQLIGEGLLTYGLRGEAAQLTARLMTAAIESLKKRHSFSQMYNAELGTGYGERNAVQGLAPLGLFLQTLGVQFISPTRLRLSGKNPFPWPVTVKYRGLTVSRQAKQTVVVFPDEQILTLNDPTDAVVSTD